MTSPVELESPNTLRNLSELAATKTLIETFKKAINALTVQDKGDAEIRDTIKLRQTRPFVAKDQGYLCPEEERLQPHHRRQPFRAACSPASWKIAAMWCPTPRTIWPCISSWTT